MRRKLTLVVDHNNSKFYSCHSLGNLDSRRDWGHARDYVEGMWKILQQTTPEDFVLSTGVMHSVRQFVEMAFNHVNVKIAWEGKGTEEVGKDEVTLQ